MGLFRAVVTCLAVGMIMRLAPGFGAEIPRLASDNLPGGFTPFYLLFTGMAAVFVLSSNAWTRSSRLTLALPLASRQVWTVRAVSLMAVALLSIAALAAVMGFSFDLETRKFTMNAIVALAAARAAATVLVLICLFQLPQSGRDRIPIGPAYVVYLIGVTFLTLVFSSALITSIAGTLILFSIAIALGTYLYRRIPPTFSIGPTVEESESPIWSMPDEQDFKIPDPIGEETLVGDQRNRSLALHWVLFRGLKTNILTWFLILIVGASATVATLEFLKGTNALLPLFFLTIYQLSLLQAALESMAPFDPLPISRRVLWAHAVGPIVISAVVGICVAGVIFLLNPRSFSQISYSECCVKVPWDYMEFSRDGKMPTITTSWGESYVPRAHPLWKGRPAALYDPFEIGKGSSQRFAEYQLQRAIEAVYGGGAENTDSSIDGTRGRISDDRNRTAAVALMTLALLITVLIFFSLLQYGNSVHRKVYKWISIGFIVFVVALAIAVSVARLFGFTEVWYIGALMSMGTRSLAHSLPLPTPILWIFCVTFSAGAYLILERVFCTIEIPREKTVNRFAEVY
jgi:hypothetical protein